MKKNIIIPILFGIALLGTSTKTSASNLSESSQNMEQNCYVEDVSRFLELLARDLDSINIGKNVELYKKSCDFCKKIYRSWNNI